MSIRKKIVWLPYDFDTAIGINNEGALVFSYNLEDTDQLEGGANVFNGQQSVVWNNIRDAFGSELRDMYRSLRSNGSLSYDKVERMFEEHQSKWPEAIFNEDSWFKYIQPLVNDGDGAYLDMLQGSKAEQRKWWLYNRFRYIDSKYNAGDALSDLIQIRGYAISNITVLPYADIYPTVKYGSYLVTTRGHRLQETTLVCPLDEVNDTEIYIYSASQLASVGDLSGFKVGFANFAMATRLQEIKIGDSDSEYDNPNLASLTLGNNVLLKKIDVRNCSGLGDTTKAGHTQQAVDISGCSIVEEVYFDGTNITGLRLPNGGVLKKLHVPASMRNLTILNQTGVTEFVIPTYANLSTLRLENVPTLNTKAILNATPASTRVRLIGFSWEVENAAEIEALLDKLDTMRGIDENDNEMTKAQVSGNIHTSSLTGSQIASYNARYPYIRITADNVTSILTFATWDGSSVISTVTCVNGVMQGDIPSVPSREQTDQYTFTAVGWNMEQDASVNDPAAIRNVTADRTVYAAYSRVVRTYTVTFKNSNNTVLQTINDVPYGGTATYTGETPVHPTAPDDYTFNGFLPNGTNITGATNCIAQFRYSGIMARKILDKTIFGDYENALVENVGDYAFYSCTSIEGVSFPAATSVGIYAFQSCSRLKNVSLPLVTSIGNYAFTGCTSIVSISMPSALSVGQNAFSSCNSLESISLPEATSIGQSAFGSCTKIDNVSLPAATSIGNGAFSYSGITNISLPSAISIDLNAFYKCANLQNISLPSATTIGDQAFRECTSLTSISLPEATSIGQRAFYYCSSLTSASLPKVTVIESYAFYGCNLLTSVSLSAVSTIRTLSLAYCASLTTVVIRNTEQVVTLGPNVFSNSNNAIIYVPDELLNNYKTATNWKSIASRIKGISELQEEV